MDSVVNRPTSARLGTFGKPLLLLALLAGLVTGPGCFNSNQPSGSSTPGSGDAVLLLESVDWGRLVDILDVDGLLVAADVLIRHTLGTDGVNYILRSNPLTEQETLQILQVRNTPAFNNLLNAAKAGLDAIETKGPNDPPTFSMAARNGAIRLVFSEFLDLSKVNSNTVQVWFGDPPVQAFSARYVAFNDTETKKGVVIIDPTISQRESATLGLPQNASGFPASFDTTNDNLLIRIPTEIESSFGQPEVLTNFKGSRALAVGPQDPTVQSTGGMPIVVRSFRSGNGSDSFNGYMQDIRRPNVINQFSMTVSQVSTIGQLREVDYQIDVANCNALEPKVGDLHEIGNGILLISAVVDDTDPTYTVRGTIVEGDVPAGFTGQGRLTTRYEEERSPGVARRDAMFQSCFLTISPEPGTLPAQNADPFSAISVTFDEPVDASTVRSMTSMSLVSFEVAGTQPLDPERYFRQDDPQETVGEYIDRQSGYDDVVDGTNGGGRVYFGPIEVGQGNRKFTLTPVAGLADSNDDGFLALALALRDGPNGIRDLAGNSIEVSGFVAGNFPQDASSYITVNGGAAAAPKDKYFVLRAMSIDENEDGLAEYDGQFNPTLTPGELRGRTLDRFSRQADSSNQFVGQALLVPPATSPFEPLTPAGAVVMNSYRPHDLGFGYVSSNEFNLDVEGMAWAPSGGSVFDDTFGTFGLALAHSNRMPDEVLNLAGLPAFPQTGLRTGDDFDANILGFPTFDEKDVFEDVYQLRSINLFTTATSQVSMLPLPNFTDTYTWRDTGISQDFKGGPFGVGAPTALVGPPIWGPPTAGGPEEEVPSIGLPLLCRFRCFPRGEFLGTNRFTVSQMVATSTLPAFRVFSAGGQDGSGKWNLVIPDNPASGGTAPNGGFNPISGAKTPVQDTFVYWAQVDFVTKISRVYTHWFAFGGAIDAVSGVNLEPDNANLPPGTSIQIEFRGSVDVRNDGDIQLFGPLTDALVPFDDYGDFIQPPPENTGGSVATPTEWYTDLNDLKSIQQGGKQSQPSKFFQLRLTFIANIDQNLEAFMGGLGMAWSAL